MHTKQEGEKTTMSPLVTFAKAFFDGVLMAVSVYLSMKKDGTKN